jgi:hypothetical protein
MIRLNHTGVILAMLLGTFMPVAQRASQLDGRGEHLCAQPRL